MKYLFILCMLYGGYSLYNNRDLQPPPEDPNVVMYSMTTCGYCKATARELSKRKIAHTEYFIDTDKQRLDEYYENMRKADAPNPYGIPTFVIYDEVLPNNPSIEAIEATIAKHQKI